MNPDNHIDRRRYTRAPIHVEIYCEGEKDSRKRGKGVICLYATDISVGGVFLESTVPFALDSLLYLRFVLPTAKEEIRIMGKVVRHQIDQDNLLEGMGIEFTHIGFAEKSLIEEYINSKQ